MEITLAQLITGFTSAMTIQGLADYLGVPLVDVRARLSALTPDEERQIAQALGL
jgi:hypothetical protein